MRCIVATLGFEASNVLRPVLTLGLQHDDKLVLVTSSVGGEYERERVKRAIQDVEMIVGEKIVVLSYPVLIEDIPQIVKDLATQCREASKIIAILSGGLRPLVLLTLSALMILWRYRDIDVKVVSMREDSLSMIEATVEYYSPPELGEKEREVLEVLAVHGGVMKRRDLVKYLREKWGTSHVIVYRRLHNLVRKRLIKVENEQVRLLPLGLAVLEASAHAV